MIKLDFIMQWIILSMIDNKPLTKTIGLGLPSLQPHHTKVDNLISAYWSGRNLIFFSLLFLFFVFDIEYAKAKCDCYDSALLTISIRKF